MSTRYIDEGYPLLHWATSIEAVCPKCGGVGVIDGNPMWRDWRATFLCHSCSHSMKTERDGWHGPVLGMGNRPCRSCGHKWVRAEKEFEDPSKIKSESSNTKCPQCNSENEVALEFTRTEPSDHAIDPFFGLELVLKEPTRHGTVWVYGAEHLKHLKEYTAAQHRVASGTKWSYFTRLPKWVKSAKNREAILKAVTKLERRLITRCC